ncbi:PREDICTED: complement component C9 [Nanorana parkeri]|uniref:complement component C9 n=1 Tax=Nanorana parkeri TaxID=125878 RepID=UPI000854CD89|nr:PREDICTED: complement component C9 [Nanorana parkeri]
MCTCARVTSSVAIQWRKRKAVGPRRSGGGDGSIVRQSSNWSLDLSPLVVCHYGSRKKRPHQLEVNILRDSVRELDNYSYVKRECGVDELSGLLSNNNKQINSRILQLVSSILFLATMVTHLPLLGLISVLCTIHWPASVSGNVRPLRETGAPPPIDCLLSSWGEWTECEPCTKQRYRSRSIVKFGQFGGKPCLSNLGEVKQCVSDKHCEEKPIDCGNDFQCENGRCIKQRLKCNVDNDCGDFSDEECEDRDPKPVCRPDVLELSEPARTSGSGINILGMDTRANPFDNENFNGLCSRVRDSSTRTYYRLPWNSASFIYRTVADKSFTSETYSDSASVVEKVLTESTESFEASLSFKLTPTELNKNGGDKNAAGDKAVAESVGVDKGAVKEAGAGQDGGQGGQISVGGEIGINKTKKESITQLKEYKLDQNKKFLRISGNVELAMFQMRTRGSVLSQTFIDDVNNLPSFYEKAEYFSILEMYGTHFAVAGSVGGKYDLVYVLDSTVLKTKDITTAEVEECLGYNLGLTVDGPGLEGAPGKSGIIDKIISFVEGGTPAFAAKLNAKLQHDEKIDIDDFVAWAASLGDNPVVLKPKTSPIYTLIPIDMKEAYTKKQHLEKAIHDYIEEYSTCKCQPCRNGGTLLVVDGECWCKCPDRFTGVACQTSKSALYEKPSTAIDGHWSCWSDSSSCVKEEKNQTRQCNNPGPQNGGKTCGGDSSRKILC